MKYVKSYHWYDRTKICNKCITAKSKKCFKVNKDAEDGLANICISCSSIQTRDRALKSTYGILLKDKKRMFRKQGERCGICKNTLPEMTKSHVDHDHNTQEIRGILCRNCNLGLGNFKDSVEYLKNAISYLQTHEVKINLKKHLESLDEDL